MITPEVKKFIEQCCNGDDDAIKILLGKCKIIISKMSNLSDEDKDDIISMVSLKLLKNNWLGLRSYRGEASFDTWLIWVVKNTVCSYKKSKLRESKIFLRREVSGKEQDSTEDFEGEKEDWDKELTKEEEVKICKELLNRLKPEERECIVNKHLYNMSQKEISEKLGINQNTVASLISRGLKKLRKMYQSKGIKY